MKERTHGGNVYAFREQMADRQKLFLILAPTLIQWGRNHMLTGQH